jgi:hypothetical protein
LLLAFQACAMAHFASSGKETPKDFLSSLLRMKMDSVFQNTTRVFFESTIASAFYGTNEKIGAGSTDLKVCQRSVRMDYALPINASNPG